MAIDPGRLKHLEMIQQIIARMAQNAFLLKGWSLTLVSAILAIAVKDRLCAMVWIAFLPCIAFWALYGYFLRRERLFRRLWDVVRAQDETVPSDFSMDTRALTDSVQSWLRACFSGTLMVFHGTVFTVVALLALGACPKT